MPSISTNHNPFSDWRAPPSAAPPPSVFGALPYPRPNSAYSVYVMSFNPTVLNCEVLGGRAKVCYTVSTDDAMPGYTVVKCAKGKCLALVEWREHPRVEVRGTVPKQDSRAWLRLSRDQTYRTMTVGEAEYTWTPDNQYVNLHSSGPSQRFFGRISRGEDSVIIEVTDNALQLGLLDPIVAAAVLLQCGQNID
ncbi:hypothetical protein GGX14DRAFT_565010 [Mycena pura]|uniref:DUF6593 domain-containing protein n=1 Tax=Mycena pura TaxID=153505 RepID=A0AAD6YDT6_9AGAR|nr:hypothetical protein GGX14DRAFT_565010 [Mycena pura]